MTLLPQTPVPRRRRCGIVLGVGAVLAVVVAGITALAVLPSQRDTSFGFALPVGYDRSNCFEAGLSAPGVITAVSCSGGSADAPSFAEFRQFSSASAAQEAFTQFTRANSVPEGDTRRCPQQVAASGIWAWDRQRRGDLACATPANGVREIVWIDPELATMGRVGRSDGDAAALWEWWVANGEL